MHFKIVKAKGRAYVYLVESHKVDGKSKHKMIHNFGALEKVLQDRTIERMILSWKNACAKLGLPFSLDDGGLEDD